MWEKIKVAAIQMNSITGNLAANLSQAKKLITEAHAQGAQLVCLPELWDCGYDIAYLQRNPIGHTDEAPSALADLSTKLGIGIAAGCAERNGDKLFNSVFCFDGEVSSQTYRKTHLFSLAPSDETTVFDKGTGAAIWNFRGVPIGIEICYDMRFPELSRALTLQGAELLLVPAAWPKVRTEIWRVLTQARAIENQIFLLASNQSCTPGKSDFAGHSMAISANGSIVSEAGAELPELVLATFERTQLLQLRESLPCLRQRRPELYK